MFPDDFGNLLTFLLVPKKSHPCGSNISTIIKCIPLKFVTNVHHVPPKPNFNNVGDSLSFHQVDHPVIIYTCPILFITKYL